MVKLTVFSPLLIYVTPFGSKPQPLTLPTLYLTLLKLGFILIICMAALLHHLHLRLHLHLHLYSFGNWLSLPFFWNEDILGLRLFEGDRYFSDCKQDHEKVVDWKRADSDGGKWLYIRLTVTLFSVNRLLSFLRMGRASDGGAEAGQGLWC